MTDEDKSGVSVNAPELKQGCGCALIILAAAIFFSFTTILGLIEKLIDKL